MSLVRSQPPSARRESAVLLSSAGQAALAPVQVSATSQTPAEARHSTVTALKPSVGQALLTPSQLSATSQAPAAGRHTAVLLASAGQESVVPVQVSATSHAPAEARHTAPALPAGCWQVTLIPSHWSTVHGLPSLGHAVPLAVLSSAGQLGLVPGQNSASSHSPAAARHAVPE